MKRTDNENIIISSEYIPGLRTTDIQKIDQLFKGICDIKIIVYLRRQDHYAWSWFAQNVKTTNMYCDLNILLRQLHEVKHILNYDHFLMPWSQTFGRDNILVNVFPPKGCLINSFFNNLNISIPQEQFIFPGNTNKSLRAEQIIFIQKYLPKSLTDRFASDNQLQCRIQKPFDIDFDYTKTLISPQRRIQMLGCFEETNNAVAKKFLTKDVLFEDTTIQDMDTWVYPDIMKNGYYEKAITYINNIT